MNNKVQFISKKILAGDNAEQAKAFDLLRNDEQNSEAIQVFNSHRRSVCEQLQHYFAGMFNDHPDEVLWSDISVNQPRDHLFNSERSLWLTTQSDHSDDDVFLLIDAATLHAISVYFLGGSLKESISEIDVSHLTDTELRFAHALLKQQCQAILNAAEQPTEHSAEGSVITSEQLPEQGSWLSLTVTVRFQGHDFCWHLWWPTHAKQDENALPAPNHARLHQLLTGVPLQLRVVLMAQKIPLSKIASLAVGDILPIELNEPTPAYLDEQLYAEGRVAEQRASLVFQVNKVTSH